ncbi:hypothetical protein C8R48DRAFT_672419 [Suillus tomentosus]|nr:hypothetical protein C8R48DRAFT_672419 [Suillus tomentosus]
MSYYVPYTTTQPFWIKDMMTHVQADRVSEFSTSGSGDNVSVYWEPVSSFTEPFKTHLPTDTILPPPSSLKNLPTLPLSPTGSPGTQPPMQLLDTEACHEIESSVSTTVPANEETSHTSHTHHQGALFEQSQTLKQMSNDNVVGVRNGQAEKRKEDKSMQAEADRLCKRKFEDADAEDNTDQGNIDKPAPKRICREKTGTDWQTVLDIIKYGEQRSEQNQMEGRNEKSLVGGQDIVRADAAVQYTMLVGIT